MFSSSIVCAVGGMSSVASSASFVYCSTMWLSWPSSRASSSSLIPRRARCATCSTSARDRPAIGRSYRRRRRQPAPRAGCQGLAGGDARRGGAAGDARADLAAPAAAGAKGGLSGARGRRRRSGRRDGARLVELVDDGPGLVVDHRDLVRAVAERAVLPPAGEGRVVVDDEPDGPLRTGVETEL